jgi:hypothetical protein
MKKAFYLMIVAIAAGTAGLLSCTPTGTTVDGPGGSKQTMTMHGTFRISGDSVYVTVSYPADTSRYCNGTSLVSHIDTAYTQPESGIPYSISNNTLTLTATNTYLSGTGYTMAMAMTLTRAGSGVDVQGTWNFTSETYSIASGTAPDSIKHMLDSLNTMINQKIASGEMSGQYIFSGSQFTALSSYSYNWADDYVSQWTNCSSGYYSTDTCSYAVTVTKQGSSSVQLHGKTSGETVTITWNAKGDQTYTSSDPAHLAGTYFANPVSCPNSIPTWFATFLTANAKTGVVLYKKSAQQMVPKKTPLPKWLRVF